MRAGFDLFLSTDEGIDTYRKIWNTEKDKTPTDVYFLTADLSKLPKQFGLSNFAHAITLNFNSNRFSEGRLTVDNKFDTNYLKLKSLGLTTFDFSKSKGNNVALIVINTSDNVNRYFGQSVYSQASGLWDSSAVDLSQTIYHEIYAHVVLKLDGVDDGNKQHEIYHGYNDKISPSQPKPGTPGAKYFESAEKVLKALKEIYNETYKKVDKKNVETEETKTNNNGG